MCIQYKKSKITLKKIFYIECTMYKITKDSKDPYWFRASSFDNIQHNECVITCHFSGLTSLPEWFHINSLQEIDCCHNKLTSLPEWSHMRNLQKIDCYRNELTTLPEWFHMNNLQEINCSGNKLTSLPEWPHLRSLQRIDCAYNSLTSLPEWFHMNNLQEIDCSGNNLTSLPEWSHMNNLRKIDCSNNNLTSLPEWSNMSNLQKIYCSVNNLTNLPEWSHMINLKYIHCSSNNLTSLPEWHNMNNLQVIHGRYNNLISLPSTFANLHFLECIYYSNNPIEYIPPNLLRRLERLNQLNNNHQDIYNDAQSVHNHHIQLSLQRSIEYLLRNKPSFSNIESTENTGSLRSTSSIMKEIEIECITHQLLAEYSQDQSVHSILNVTFEEVLIAVWSKIRISPHKDEIIKILNIEMLDSECKCFTGRLTRLVNCLVGFDENIKMEISENEQMSNISSLIYEKYYNDESPDDNKEYKEQLRRAFMERGYSEEDVQNWLNID